MSNRIFLLHLRQPSIFENGLILLSKSSFSNLSLKKLDYMYKYKSLNACSVVGNAPRHVVALTNQFCYLCFHDVEPSHLVVLSHCRVNGTNGEGVLHLLTQATTVQAGMNKRHPAENDGWIALVM